MEFRIPVTHSFFHQLFRDLETADLMLRSVYMGEPSRSRHEEQEKVERVRAAATPEQVIDLVLKVHGESEILWEHRVIDIGLPAVPIILDRLLNQPSLSVDDLNDYLCRYICMLRWFEHDGARALMQAFDCLPRYAQGIACVALGSVQERDAADLMWDFYQRSVQVTGRIDFVGGLWGLMDIEDPRLPGLLIDLLEKERHYVEEFGFLCYRGDERAILPLLRLMATWSAEHRVNLVMALANIGHRVGADVFRVEFMRSPYRPPDEHLAVALAEKILRISSEAAQLHFTMCQPVTVDPSVAAKSVDVLQTILRQINDPSFDLKALRRRRSPL